jgi:hypothetical protein
MERTGQRIVDRSIPHASRTARRLQAGWLLLAGALALGGCYVVPARRAYLAPGPVYLAPAPVYVYGGYGWRRY